MCKVLAVSCINTGTHELQNIRADTTSEAGEIVVSGQFIDAALPDNGRATGFIAIAYNTESEDRLSIKPHYGIARRANRQQFNVEVIISNLSESNYRVSVFSLQQNGVPFNKSVATARHVSNISLTGKDTSRN